MSLNWSKVLTKYPEANFLQSPNWGKVNQKVGHLVILRTLASSGWCQMIVKNAKRGRYLEVPGGPLINWHDSKQIQQIFTQIRQVAKEQGCAFVRIRPQLPNTPENQMIFTNLGARPAPMHLHAEHTVMIDLTSSTDDLLANMRRQTRYEVRRSLKQNIQVSHGNSEALSREFHSVQAETARLQHFVPPDLAMLLAERRAFGKDAQIYVAKTSEGAPIAYALILISGSEAEYFEAASTELHRKMPGAYAIQWQVMQDLKKQGIKRYNLWGIAPKNQPHHRYAGVTTFKTGFGGRIVEYLPAQDIVISHLRYLPNLIVEKVRKKRRHL